MSCPSCETSTNSRFCPHLVFGVDGTFLTPMSANFEFEPVDLQPLIAAAETDTYLELDLTSKSLIFNGERSLSADGTPDTITVASISALIKLTDLGDVTGAPNAGDLLVFNALTQNWEAYTVPSGTIISTLGLDSDGNPVKADSEAVDPTPSTPIGSIIIWPGDTGSIPAGYFICDGQELNRSIYAALFAIVGTQYGPGNGTTTFNAPNLSGRTAVGRLADGGPFNALGAAGGARTNNLQHSHTVNAHNHYDGNANTGTTSNNHFHGGITRGGGATYSDGQTADHTHVYSRATGNSAPGTDAQLSTVTNNLQPFLTILYIIRGI